MTRIAGAAALLVAALVAAEVPRAETGGSPPLPAGDEAALLLRDNVVKIVSQWEDGHAENGFGIIAGEVDGDLFIATANHVVRNAADPFAGDGGDASEVRVEFFSRRGEMFPATLLATSNPDDDLAVLRAQAPNGVSWRQQALSSDQAERSMPVWYVGRSGDWYVPSSPGAINNIGLDKRIAVDDLNVQVGTSGAPLVGESGIMGIIVEESGGIAYVLPIGFIESAFRFWNHPWQLAALSGGSGTQQSSNQPCRITGLVFDSESNQPIPGVWIDLYRDIGQSGRPEQLQANVATSGPNGQFSVNCGGVDDSEFPLLLAVRHRDWVATRITGQSIRFKDQWEGINIALAMSTIELRNSRSGSQNDDTTARDFARGEALYNRGDFREALPLLTSAADAGHGKAAYYLGSMYLNGRGVTKDESLALKWVRAAAAAGEAEGFFLMGTIYARGLAGQDRNDRGALRFYEQAADAGSTRAYWQLGIRYEQGIGVEADVRSAIAWYQRAAAAGNRPAEEALARLGVSR